MPGSVWDLSYRSWLRMVAGAKQYVEQMDQANRQRRQRRR